MTEHRTARRVLSILIFLLLGAVINVVVAWIPAWEYASWFPARTEPISMEDARGIWRDHARPSWPDDFRPADREISLLWTYEVVTADTSTPPGQCQVVRITQGWPVRSMQRFTLLGSGGGARHSAVVFRMPTLGGRGSRLLVLSLSPVWPGFALNTLVYAAILWLLWLCPFAFRRQIRRKRGRCVRCGYDLRGELEHGCPECGWRREKGGTASERSESAV